MPALRIRAKLNLVHRKKGRAQIERHRFDRADKIARLGRHDLLFAGDQRGGLLAFDAYDPVINLAREQAQRQSDHAGAVREHPLDREMGLACVGGP